MDLAQLILEVIILIGIFYVVFIQDRATKIKNSLLKTLKDYPEAAEAFLKMEKRRIKEEIEKQFESRAEKNTKVFLDDIINLIGVLFKLSSVFAYEPYFEKSINEIKNVFFKQRLLNAIQKARENLKSLGIEEKGYSGAILRALLTRGDLIKEISHPSSQKK